MTLGAGKRRWGGRLGKDFVAEGADNPQERGGAGGKGGAHEQACFDCCAGLTVAGRPVVGHLAAATLIPLFAAGLVTLEICAIIGMPLNFANIIALPLLLGVGVAFKIYYIMAWREGQTRLLQSVLTRAVTFSACATAFGSLYFSSDPGTSSMGKLLAISLLTTMTAAAFFQPMLMGKPRDKELHQHERLKRVAAMSD
jgi:predicted exporter